MFEHNYDLPDSLSQRLAIAIRHIEFARVYSSSLLQDLTEDQWYWTPDSYTTHIAWQAGHLAMSQYGLTLYRQRGRNLDVDKKLMSSKFRKLFMRGTKPVADRAAYPAPSEIIETLDRVHAQMRIEVATFSEEDLDQPLDAPHAAFATRYGALLFAGDHEMIHSGQIGMLRRLMGLEPLR
ncbi:MAG: hypothetical protein ACI87E_004498 [Mariniblastus sp.]|jgi:hypothetical protein